MILEGMGERYKAFTEFLVMTGTRFGEATAVTVADVDLMSKPATMRINKAWKRGADSEYYIGATKTGAGKRTVSLEPAFGGGAHSPGGQPAWFGSFVYDA